MPPERSVDHEMASGLLPPIFWMTASSFRPEVLVPAELLEHRERELGIAVLDLRADGVGPFGQEIVRACGTVRKLDLTFDAEARAERATTVHHMQVRVVQHGSSRMPQIGRSPAWPRQTVIVATDLWIVLGRAQRYGVELRLVPQVCLQAFRQTGRYSPSTSRHD